MIVTDGAQTEPGDPHIPADKLKSRGFEIYTVAAGDASKILPRAGKTEKQRHVLCF